MSDLLEQDPPAPAPLSAAVANRRSAFARRVLLDALFLGGLADALLHDGFGLGLVVWMIVFAATLVYLARARGQDLSKEQVAWLGTAIFFAACLAWRDSAALWFYDFLAMLAALGILGATLSRSSAIRSILGQRVRDLAQQAGATVKHVATGLVRLVFQDSTLGGLTRSWRTGRAGAVVRASLMALPLLVVFGLLFGAADPLFEKLLSLPTLNFDEIASHLAVAGFFTWVVGGWLRGALVDSQAPRRLPDGVSFTLGTLDVTVMLGGLVALFALFVGVQVSWLFGGEGLVRSTTGLGYAQYARHGFFELVWVSLLVLPVVLATHAAIPASDRVAQKRHRQLALALLALLGGVMTSALGRMALYVHYYGMSADRLFASVFMGWLAIVFLWLAFTVLRGRAHDFAAGMAITGFATLAALNVANPDAVVARVNVSRAARAVSVADSIGSASAKEGLPPAPIDYDYLTLRLGGDAAEEVLAALLAPPVATSQTPAREAEVRERCDAVRRMLDRWGSRTAGRNRGRQTDWRLWEAGDWRAREAVRSHETALRAVTCWDSGGEAPFSDRDQRPPQPGEQAYVTPSTLSSGGGRQ